MAAPKRTRAKGKALRTVFTATELVVDCIYRSAFHLDTRSKPGAEAHQRLLALAEAIDPGALKLSMQEQGNFVKGMASVINSITQKTKKGRKK